MSSVIADVRYAARELRRRPGFALTAVLSLALLGGVTILLLAVAVIACLAPARRAASIDPMEALRHE